MLWWLLLLCPCMAQISHVYVISVHPPLALLVSVESYYRNVTWVPAVTKINASKLPLYARYLLDRGRHGHMEVSTRGMIGCFESHRRVWGMVMARSPATALVLEEDAMLVTDFDKRLQRALGGTSEPWDLVMLTDRLTQIAYGADQPAGLMTRKCLGPCEWFGTRGYVLSVGGAEKLLANMQDMVVQVDAYMTLLAIYKGLRLQWSSEELVGQISNYRSQVQDECWKCDIPPGASFQWFKERYLWDKNHTDNRIIMVLLFGAVAAFWYYRRRRIK